MSKTVGIVGAGFAGLSTARIFDLYGITPTVYEKEPEVGGVWASSRRYPGLTTQNPKDTYYLSELKMDKSYPEWPLGHQVQEYMEKYVDHVDIRKHLRLNTSVTKTYMEGDKWVVESEKDGVSARDVYDYLIVCNGIFSDPFIPPFKGTDAFKAAGGRVCHTSQFNEKQDAKDKNMVIVGYGKSSLDVASHVSDLAKNTNVVARSIIWKVPKKFFGVVNMKLILLTRLGENLFEYIRPKGAAKALHGPLKFVRNGLLGGVQKVVTKQLKLNKTGLNPGNSLETIARANVSLASDNFFNKVESGNIKVNKTEITELLPSMEAILKDGSKIPADIVVCGTGWKQRVPFMDEKVMENVLDDNGDYRLYKNQLPFGTKNLAFNGYNSSFYSQLSSEIGALWLAEYFTGGLNLPNEAEMKRATDEQLAWSKERSEGKNSKGTNIIPFTMNHVDELLEDVGYDVSGFKKFVQWNLPIAPADYKPIIHKAVARYEKERKDKFLNS